MVVGKMNKKNNILETIGIFLIIFNIYFSYIKYLGFSLFLPALFGCILLFISKGRKFKTYTCNLKFLLILIIVLFSCVTHFTSYSFSYLIKFFIGFLILLIFENFTNEDSKRILSIFKKMSLFFAIATIVSCFTQPIYFKIVDFLYNKDISATIINLYNYKGFSGLAGQTGNNAFLILIGGIIVIYDLFFDNNKNKFLSIISLLIIIVSILLTDKRMFLLLLIIVLMIYTYVYLKNKKLTKRKMMTIMIGLIVFCSFSYYAVNNFKVFSRFSDTSNMMNGRDTLALLAIHLIKENYLFGVGINNYIPASGQPIYTHNVFLQLTCELGVFFAAIAILIIISTLFKKTRYMFRNAKGELEIVSTFSTFVQIIFVLYFFTGNSFYDANMLYIYFLCQAFFDVYLRGEKSEENRNSYISQSN